MLTLTGRVSSGVGDAAEFIRLPWVRDAIRRSVGLDPYPGTLNVRLVDAEMLAAWRATMREGTALRLEPPDPHGCGARLFPVVVVPHVAAAIIVPDVTRYGDDVLEVIAAVHLRTALALGDGDRVTLARYAPAPSSL
jgi:riboflavin kinase